jgi:predicted DNA-binding transcriptional regulator YafY
MADQATLLRHWVLLRTLGQSGQGVAVRDLAREHEVNEKTIRRDLGTLRGVGFPVESTSGPHGLKRWRLARPSGVDLKFNLDEALALYLGCRLLDPFVGTTIGDSAARAFQKLRGFLPHSAVEYVSRLSRTWHATSQGAAGYAGQSDLLDRLLLAVSERRQCVMTYRSARSTEPVEHAIHPYGIVQHKGSLYVVAWSEDHKEVRTFKLNRIGELEVSGIPFRQPEDFSLSEYLAGSFGVFHGKGQVRVRVRFSK